MSLRMLPATARLPPGLCKRTMRALGARSSTWRKRRSNGVVKGPETVISATERLWSSEADT